MRTGGQVADMISELFGGDLDPRRTAGQQALQTLTGVRVTKVDEMDRLRARQNSIKEALVEKVRTGDAGQLQVMYAKDKDDPALQAALKELREIGKQKKELQQNAR